MDVGRAFETTVIERELGIGLTCLSLPRLSWGDYTPETLGLEELVARAGPSEISLGLLALLTSDEADNVRQFLETNREIPPREFLGQFVDRQLADFAEYVAHAPMIAFEASPLEFGSLAGIAAATGTAGIGTTVGLAAVGTTPLLFITVPAGIVIVGVSLAFTQGLRYHILRLMGVPRAASPQPTEREQGV